MRAFTAFTGQAAQKDLTQRSRLSGFHSEGGRLSTKVCAKKDIHPKYYDEAKVICNGEEVLTTSGTQEQYTVDIWSGNHPFYTNSENSNLTEEGRISRFNKRFGEGLSMGKVGSSKPGEKRLEYQSPSKKKLVKGKGGKK